MKVTHTLAALAITTMTSNAITLTYSTLTKKSSIGKDGVEGIASGNNTIFNSGAGAFDSDAVVTTYSSNNSRRSQYRFQLDLSALQALNLDMSDVISSTISFDYYIFDNGAGGASLQLTAGSLDSAWDASAFDFINAGTEFTNATHADGGTVGSTIASPSSNYSAKQAFVIDANGALTNSWLSGTNNGMIIGIDNSGGISNYDVTADDSGKTFGIAIDESSIMLTVVAVPEPSSTALLGLGGLALILRRRK